MNTKNQQSCCTDRKLFVLGNLGRWDSQNRLRQCVHNGNTSVFTYGFDGLRRRSVVNGVTTDFVVDGSTAVRERRNGTNIATYFAGLCRRDDATGQVRWYIQDGLGSVLAEVNPQGSITASRKYDVYGLVRSGNAVASNPGSCDSLSIRLGQRPD